MSQFNTRRHSNLNPEAAMFVPSTSSSALSTPPMSQRQYRSFSEPLPESYPALSPRKRGPPLPRARIPLKPEDVVVGSIIWLHDPLEGDEPITCVRRHMCYDSLKQKDGHNHPVLVLRIRQRPGSDIIGDLILDIAPMSSLNNLTILDYLQRLEELSPIESESVDWWFKSTMPLYYRSSSGPYPGIEKDLKAHGNPMLYLSTGRMQRQTYIRVLHAYAVPITQVYAVNQFNPKAYQVRLAEDSYKLIMQKLMMITDYWQEDPANRRDERLQRLVKLRDNEVRNYQLGVEHAYYSQSTARNTQRSIPAVGGYFY